MGDAVLVARNLTKIYLRVPAVDHVSMTVNRGDIYGFIGANGAGKTTFMRMICGLVKPAGGEIELFGVKGTKALQEARKKMGALIEHPAIYPNMSAMENLEIQRRYLGMNRENASKETLRDLLELVGLGDAGLKQGKMQEAFPWAEAEAGACDCADWESGVYYIRRADDWSGSGGSGRAKKPPAAVKQGEEYDHFLQ